MLSPSRLLSLAFAVLLSACAAHPAGTDNYYFGNRAVKIEQLTPNDVEAFLADDWARFDKHVKDVPDWMTPGKVWSVDWHLEVTPPFPTNWPPLRTRSVTYYAYGEYQEGFMHGPALSRSAPWAKVVLTEGMAANKVILARRLGPAVNGEASVRISNELADRKTQIINDGEAYLPGFMSSKSIPDNQAEIKAIREYYCQWILTNRTADLIEDNHRAFFQWLSCPPKTLIPVLAPSH